MKKFLVVAAVIALTVVFTSCGGGGSSSIIPPPVDGGGNSGFSNASLNGTWVFTARGSGTANDFAVLGIFTADGNGRITSGSQDVNDSSSGYTANTPVTGTYSVNQDGRGQVQLNFNGGNVVFRFVLTSGSRARLFEVSGLEDANGQMFKQDSTAISNLAGNYVLRLDGYYQGSIDSIIGQIKASGGPSAGTLSATLDENFAGSLTEQMAASGNFTMSANGKGATAIAGAAGTFNLAYYIVSSNHIEFLETDTGGILSGGADLQGSDFSNAALNGPLVFSVAGIADSGTTVDSIKEIGRIQLNGGGAITAGLEDYNWGGNFQENVGYSGTYDVQSDGRFTLHFVYADNTTADYVGWLTSAQNGVLVTADASIVESGTLRLQTGTPTSATLSGNYGLAYSGVNYANGYNVLQTSALTFNGSGGINGTEDFQAGGTLAANSGTTGTYSVSSNGHASGTLGGVPFRFYIADSSTAYFIAADPQRGYSGVLVAQ